MECLCMSCLLSVLPGVAGAPEPPPVSVEGDFTVRVGPGEIEVDGRVVKVAEPVVLEIAPADSRTVTDERYGKLPVFDPEAAPWIKGAKLRGVQTLETTAADMLDPESVRLKAGPGDAEVFEADKDYGIDLRWGTFGRLEGGAIGAEQPVYADYRHGVCRIDSIILDAAGAVSLAPGTPHVNVPRPPELAAGRQRIANIWVPGRLAKLAEANLFPILADAFPQTVPEGPTAAERLLAKTMAKLRSGEKLTVMAWGDSVTVGTFVPDWEQNRWQAQFAARLREAFPEADIELVTVAWGAQNSRSFLDEPPGSQYNYQEQVLDRKPDLIVSEFVNDAYLTPEGVEELYGKLLADFRGIGAEWIILTPHYVRPEWMGLTSERDCDDDPRPYVAGLREFAERHSVALADASPRWGHLWRQGIPYTTLLLNAINHQDERGMKLFADALMALFPR